MPTAVKGLERVVEYLNIHWTEKELRQLDSDISSTLNRIERNHAIGIITKKRNNTRKSYPNKHTYLVYRIKPRKKVVEIVAFGATKEKPTKY